MKHIEETLKRNAELEADAIRVSVIDGQVKLESKVKAWFERQLAEQAAWAGKEVPAVEDDLRLN